jgi:hypothetical protein
MGMAAKATAWWWNNEVEGSKVWSDLHGALDVLEEAHLDLADDQHLAFVLDIGKRHLRGPLDNRELAAVTRLHRLVERFGDLNSKGRAEPLRQELLEKLRAEVDRLSASVGARPARRGHPTDWQMRETIGSHPPRDYLPWALRKLKAPAAEVEAAEAKEKWIDWDADTIAAALLVTGARRSPFESVKRAVRASVRRRKPYRRALRGWAASSASKRKRARKA